MPDDTQITTPPDATKEEEPTNPTSDNNNNHQDGALTRISSGPPYSIFSDRAKLLIVLMVALCALISPFAATLFYPALNVLAAQLGVSDSLITLSVSTYMIAQAIAPALVAGVSDSGGRRTCLIFCFVVYIVANIGLALQTDYAALLVLRCVQASGSSPAIALSIAVVADVATSAERGKFMGYATSGILVGPAIGPVIGGGLAEGLGWRSIFWFLVIFGVVMLIILIVAFPETCRNVVGNGSIPARGWNKSLIGHWQQRKMAMDVESQISVQKKNRKISWPNPLSTLKIVAEKESGMLLVYNGLFFNGMMVIATALPYILKTFYGYNELQVGLCFLPLGGGSLLSALCMGRVVDWNFARHAKRINMPLQKGKQQDLTAFPLERSRLEIILPSHILGTVFITLFGWLLHLRTHIAGPATTLFFIGLGVTTSFSTSNTLIVDLHRSKPAAATAAVNFVRCLISAGGVAAIVPMIEKLGVGWTFTFLGGLFVAVCPMLWALDRYGPGWRREKARREGQSEKEMEGGKVAAELAAREDERSKEADVRTKDASPMEEVEKEPV